MPSPMRVPSAVITTSSTFGDAQPPCVKPSRVSSSGRPGDCMTPSSVTWLITTTRLIEEQCAERSRVWRVYAAWASGG